MRKNSIKSKNFYQKVGQILPSFFFVKVQKSGLSLKIYLVNFYQKVGQILPSFFFWQSPKIWT